MFFLLGQEIVRSEIKEKIQSGKDLEEIIVAQNEINKYLHTANELNIDGRIYDIVTSEIKGSNIIFLCIHDAKKEFLFSNLDEFLDFEGDQEDKEDKHHHFVKFLYLESNINSENSLIKTNVLLASLEDTSHNFSTLSISPDILPPKNTLFV